MRGPRRTTNDYSSISHGERAHPKQFWRRRPLRDVPRWRRAVAALIAPSASAHTRRAIASALGRIALLLDGRRLDDASLAADLGHIQRNDRTAATAAVVVAAVRHVARAADAVPPAGPLTRQALEGFRPHRGRLRARPERSGPATSPPTSATTCSLQPLREVAG